MGKVPSGLLILCIARVSWVQYAKHHLMYIHTCLPLKQPSDLKMWCPIRSYQSKFYARPADILTIFWWIRRCRKILTKDGKAARVVVSGEAITIPLVSNGLLIHMSSSRRIVRGEYRWIIWLVFESSLQTLESKEADAIESMLTLTRVNPTPNLIWPQKRYYLILFDILNDDCNCRHVSRVEEKRCCQRVMPLFTTRSPDHNYSSKSDTGLKPKRVELSHDLNQNEEEVKGAQALLDLSKRRHHNSSWVLFETWMARVTWSGSFCRGQSE